MVAPTPADCQEVRPMKQITLDPLAQGSHEALDGPAVSPLSNCQHLPGTAPCAEPAAYTDPAPDHHAGFLLAVLSTGVPR